MGMDTTYVSVDGWMEKESVVHIYAMNTDQPLKKKKGERHPAICNSIDETGGHYANEISQTQKLKKKNAWSHLYVGSKKSDT